MPDLYLDPTRLGDGAHAVQPATARDVTGDEGPETSSSPQQRTLHSQGPFSGEDVNITEAHSTSAESNETSEGRYQCLTPLLPFLGDTIPISLAYELFDVYLVDPGTSLFQCASPYILSRIFRKKSLLRSANPRKLSPALLVTILWCCTQTADISALLVPGSRSRYTNSLYELATFLVHCRDPDRWRRIHGGLRAEKEQAQDHVICDPTLPTTADTNEPVGTADDVLTFLLLCIGVSAGDFKSDCNKWWSKAARLAMSLQLNREDVGENTGSLPSLMEIEGQEERRRVFWLLYSLDRHLALSFNRTIQIPDFCCEVYAPLPDSMWETLDDIDISTLPARTLGPPTNITGAGFFEYFLPLMVILGDIIEVQHSQHHPRLGNCDNARALEVIKDAMADCETSLKQLARGDAEANNSTSKDALRLRLAIAYSSHILHVLYVLLHGKWDPISMLDNDDDWITTPRFIECASHAIAASEAVSEILDLDPELMFMPYLFGIYLLHGSFILLLFADRMPQLGPNKSVEQACETIIRAHEVCVVTLNTEFQRSFRRVLRLTLYSVRRVHPARPEEHNVARRQVLSLYRWTKSAKGLGI
ncbi:hypothetical protein BGZ61DRAFT_555763 [Ilyonectria robusta]|uniref:uncharacterized protein n=1 Tax=Ilyonectria robusta TaxID=1079257 RepID=UPI001E8EA64E|nr:uncharacterized protein BGZ61DRAFT_555763 [Ilyonectria robusta]KAH8672157.1 hypothetical protein BGZ61DRAFT_555763 [Ilyonectria robusta]